MAKRKRLSFDSPLGPAPSDTGAPPIAGVVADASASAALAEMSQTLVDAREGGRMLLSLPLDHIELDYLVRDRVAHDDDDMEALCTSLRARGQQVPIEVTRLGPDRYGLISGWRRCQALRRLFAQTGEARFGVVDALLRQPAESSDAYCAMVEENEIRVGLSYYERARIVARSVQQGVFPDTRAALRMLFASASRAKRSKIGTFLPIVDQLDGVLRFPTAIGERQGLVLGRALEEDAALAERLAQALHGVQSPEDEVARVTAALTPVTPAKPRADKPTPEPICPGIDMTVHPNGTITLTGARVTLALAARLRGFLGHDKGA